MVQLVLGTDMRSHFQLVAQFKAKLGICATAAKNASPVGSSYHSRRTSAMSISHHRGSMEMPLVVQQPPCPAQAMGSSPSGNPLLVTGGQTLTSHPESGSRDQTSSPSQIISEAEAGQQDRSDTRAPPPSSSINEGEIVMTLNNASLPQAPARTAAQIPTAAPAVPVALSRTSSIPSSLKSSYGSGLGSVSSSVTLDTLMPLDDELRGLVLKVQLSGTSL